MKIALIGASGLVGSAVLEEALNRGHEVTAIVREPQKIKLQSDKLTAVKADINNTEEAVALLQNHDVIVSAFSVSPASENIYADSVTGYHAVQKAAKEAGARRFFVVIGAGSLYIQPGVQLIDTPQFPEAYKAGASAARDYFTELKKETDLNWTALSPAIEFHPGIPHQRIGHYRTGTDSPVFDAAGRSTISAEDLAVAIVDELEHPKFIKQRFTVAY